MKVSLITVCFNSDKTITDTIQSVISQTYSNIEYIIVDGKSTDKTVDIIKSHDNHISKWISEKDSGIYNAFNKGIQMASGDLIGFVHSDDELYSNDVVEEVVKTIKKTNTDSLYADGIYVNDRGKRVRNWISKEFKYSKLKRGWMPLHPTFYVKKLIYDKYGSFDETKKVSSDYQLVLEFLYKNKITTCYLNKYIIKMKDGGNSTSFKNMFKKFREDLSIMKQYHLNRFIAFPYKTLSKLGQFV